MGRSRRFRNGFMQVLENLGTRDRVHVQKLTAVVGQFFPRISKILLAEVGGFLVGRSPLEMPRECKGVVGEGIFLFKPDATNRRRPPADRFCYLR